MTNKWMLGTAVAALIAASPAFAQGQSDFGECALADMTNETFTSLDTDDTTGLSMEEYTACPEQMNLDLSDDAMTAFEDDYSEANADGNDVLTFAEVEDFSGSDASQQAAGQQEGEDDAPEGTVTVTQPAPEVVVEQPSPDVVVAQPEPEVAVETQQPEVEVQTPEPEVAVETPAPEVEVEQPQPTVAVEQPEPEIAVQQPEPEVDVEAGQPAVEVETAEPQVAVDQPEPEVEVEQPELDVEVEQQDPDVAVRQGSADVAVQNVTEEDVDAEMADEAEMEETDVAVAEGETEVAAAEAEVVEYSIAIDDIIGEDVYNTAGEELGEVEDIVLDTASNTPIVVVSVGGFLGLGDREVAFPYDDMTVTGDQIVLDTAMTEDEIGEMPEYEETDYEPLPETMIVR